MVETLDLTERPNSFHATRARAGPASGAHPRNGGELAVLYKTSEPEL